jgi:general L-amino acid transport system ATP-binding protein
VHGTRLGNDAGSVRKIRENVGMVFQQFNLFPHLTVLENCILAPMTNLQIPEAEASKTATSFLERVQIPDQAHKLPGQLSGGQQQRVAIARALCMQPRLMLFDEPTSSLDPEMIKEVLDTMVSLANEGMSMICVTHELNFAKRVANRIIFMDEGRIVEEQPPIDFFANPKTDRAKLFLSQILNH